MNKLSLRTADVFPVVASLPPKRRDDRKYVCRWRGRVSFTFAYFTDGLLKQ